MESVALFVVGFLEVLACVFERRGMFSICGYIEVTTLKWTTPTKSYG